MNQCYIYANLVKIHSPVHDIVQTRKYHADTDSDANRIHTKQYVILPFSGGHKNQFQ